jgi:hypothetical protein
MVEKCGCTRYYMPRNKTTPICTAKDLVCSWEENGNFYENIDENPCDCYPACNNIEYELFSVSDDDLEEDMTLGEFFRLKDLKDDKDRFEIL